LKKEDCDSIDELLHELGCETVSINGFTRLGRKQEGNQAKPRSIKLTLSSESQKDWILKNSKNLRNSINVKYKEVFLHQDRTPKQQEARHKLVQELKTRQSSGEPNLILVNDRIVQRWTRGEAP